LLLIAVALLKAAIACSAGSLGTERHGMPGLFEVEQQEFNLMIT
jgi:hypothetical protein